jgi:hypothetical protein
MESRMDAQTMAPSTTRPGFDRAVATSPPMVTKPFGVSATGRGHRRREQGGGLNNRFLIQSLTRSEQTVTATIRCV